MGQFFVYEEYAARYHSMMFDMTFATKAIPNWEAYERGLETLAKTLAPNSHRDPDVKGKNSLTMGDLLIKASSRFRDQLQSAHVQKPVQRICRYPLLFEDLIKATPVIDSPEVHEEVEKVFYRLREAGAEIDRATSDDYAKDRIQRSWRLQDMLAFPDLVCWAQYEFRGCANLLS